MRIREVKRPIDDATIAALDRVDRKCFPGLRAYNKRDRYSRTWVVEHRGEVVAFACSQDFGDGIVYLSRCGVLPEFRGRGLQRKLIRARVLAARFASVYTYTVIGNVHSANNLIACGFRMFAPDDPYAGRISAIYWRRQ